MHKILLAAAAAFLLTGCTNIARANGDGWVVHEGDIVVWFTACRGEENGEALLQNKEEERLWNDDVKARLFDERCSSFRKALPGVVHRVVRASVDFEDDIVFLVEFRNTDGNGAGIYSLVWEATVIGSDPQPEQMRGQPI